MLFLFNLVIISYSISELGELLSDFLDFRKVKGSSSLVGLLEFSVVELLGSGLSFLFQSVDEVLLVPSEQVAQLSEEAELLVGSKSDNLQGVWDDLSVLGIVWGWDSIENLDSSQSGSSLGSLVWQHTSDGSPEDSGWGSVMVETSLWVSSVGLLHELLES